MMKVGMIACLIFLSVQLFGQVGDVFPDMEGETLTNKMISMPEAIKGKYSLIGLAFSKKSEKDLQTWFQPIYNQFIEEPDPNAIFSFEYDLNVYMIPMFTGAKRAAYKKVMKKVKESVDPKLEGNILFYKGTIHHYKDALKFQGQDLPYFYVLDKDANIIYTTSGKYTRKKMQEIIDAVEPASK